MLKHSAHTVKLDTEVIFKILKYGYIKNLQTHKEVSTDTIDGFEAVKVESHCNITVETRGEVHASLNSPLVVL